MTVNQPSGAVGCRAQLPRCEPNMPEWMLFAASWQSASLVPAQCALTSWHCHTLCMCLQGALIINEDLTVYEITKRAVEVGGVIWGMLCPPTV